MNRNLDADVYCHRSQDFYVSYRFDKSIICCKRALTIKPDYYYGHFRWGSSLNGKDSYEKSIRKHKEIICRNPKDHIAYNNFGVALERQNMYIEAEMKYKKSIEIDSSDQVSLHNLAILLTKQRKYTKALEQFEKNLQARDETCIASTYNCYGFLKFILGKYEEAIESFEKAIYHDSNLSLPYFNKVLVLYCLGRSELAIETFKETIKKLGSSPGWHQVLQQNIFIYVGELKRFKGMCESDDLGEVNRDQLIVNIRGLEYIADRIKQELEKLPSRDDVGL